MNTRVHTQTKAEVKPSSAPVQRGLLQRKCMCGGAPGVDGECAECRRTRLQRQPDRRAEPTGMPAIVHDVLRSSGQPLGGTGVCAAPSFGHDFSQVRIQPDVRAARAPGAPANEFEDCPTDWQRKANAALVLARRWVENVVVGLSSLPYPFPAPVANLLNRHFRITGRGYVYEVRRHFNTIHSALNSPIDFECETECDDSVAAYVYSVWTDVHLCPIWYGLTPAGRANTIIHEIAHDAANRDDEAYIWEAKYSKLSVEDAVDNADSYSNFAEEAYGP